MHQDGSQTAVVSTGANRPVRQGRLFSRRRISVSDAAHVTSEQQLFHSFAERRNTLARHFLGPDTANRSNVKPDVIRLGCWHDSYAEISGFNDVLKSILVARINHFVGKKVLDLTATTGLTSALILDLLLGPSMHTTMQTILVSNEPAKELFLVAEGKIASTPKPHNTHLVQTMDAMNDDGIYDAILVVGSIHYATDEERLALATMAYGRLPSGGTLTVIDRVPWRLDYSKVPSDIGVALEELRTPFDIDTFELSVRQAWERLKGDKIAVERDSRPTRENHGSTITALTFVK